MSSGLLGLGRPISQADYWKFGRIFGQLGIWFQTGLLAFMAAAAMRWHGENQQVLIAIILAAAVKNVWLFMYCRGKDLINDRLEPWLLALAFDVLTFLAVLPIYFREYLHDAGIFSLLGLHYALAFCLRWRSAWSYLSLLVPSLFFLAAWHLGSAPTGWQGSLAQLVLGLVFVAASREAFLRDTRRVEEQVRGRRLQDAASVVVDAERAAVLGEAIDVHRVGVSPLRRLALQLDAAGEREAGASARAMVDEVRRLLELRIGSSAAMALAAFIGYARQQLAVEGVRLHTGELPNDLAVPDDIVQAFVAFAKDVVPAGRTLEVRGLVYVSDGRPAFELDMIGLQRARVGDWVGRRRVDIGSDGRSMIFYLTGRPIEQ
jgi:hypothetical protein